MPQRTLPNYMARTSKQTREITSQIVAHASRLCELCARLFTDSRQRTRCERVHLPANNQREWDLRTRSQIALSRIRDAQAFIDSELDAIAEAGGLNKNLYSDSRAGQQS